MGNLRTSSRKYKEGDYVVYILRDFIGYMPHVCKVVKDHGEEVSCYTLIGRTNVRPRKDMLTLIPCAFWADTYKPDRDGKGKAIKIARKNEVLHEKTKKRAENTKRL